MRKFESFIIKTPLVFCSLITSSYIGALSTTDDYHSMLMHSESTSRLICLWAWCCIILHLFCDDTCFV